MAFKATKDVNFYRFHSVFLYNAHPPLRPIVREETFSLWVARQMILSQKEWVGMTSTQSVPCNLHLMKIAFCPAQDDPIDRPTISCQGTLLSAETSPGTILSSMSTARSKPLGVEAVLALL